MNQPDSATRGQRPRRTARFRATPVAAACSTLAVMLSAPAMAQDAANPPEQLQTVVVTGLRHSIESSVAVKRNSDSIVEAISAEDIGKLPDVSIGEALARLPGLAGQRVAGRAQVIAIRGLSQDFVGTTLNGREQVTTGDNRGVEFDQFPSELINGATIYKTPDAALIGQGLAGTVDLEAIRPLDMAQRSIVLNARAEYNSNGALNDNTSATGGRLSVSYVDQFADRTVGVALGFAHLDSPGQEKHYKAWGFSVGEENSFCAQHHADWGCSPVSGVPVGDTYLNGFEVEALSRKQTRDGLMAVIEYKPNKNIHSVVDLYYSKFSKDETMRGLMGGFGDNWNGVPGAAFSNIGETQVGANTTLITSGTVANANMIVRNDLNTRDDEMQSIGWNLSAKVGPDWTLVGDLSYSRAHRTENVIETYAGAPNLGTFDFTVPTGVGFPSLVPTNVDYADAASVMLRDPGGWGHDGLWKKPKATDELQAIRLDAKRDLDWGVFSRVDFGVNYSERTKEREMNELALNLKNGRAPVLVDPSLVDPATSLSFAGIPGVLSYDVMGVIDRYMDVSPQAVDQIISRNFSVNEKVSTAFAKLDIDTSIGSVPVRGNLGVQFIHTDQSSDGFRKELDGTISEVTAGKAYDDVLPSLNLVFELPANQVVRFGVAKSLSRGRMDDMRAGSEVSLGATDHKWSGSGGNPQLEPWRATSYDLSWEKYFGKRSYVAAAYFFKDLETYIYKQQVERDFSGVPNPTPIVPDGNLGLYTTPANGNGGWVQGLELSTSLDAGNWLKPLEGFGVAASIAYTKSNLNPPEDLNGAPKRLPGLSGVVSNVTVYYEQSGFSARISQRFRSAFRGEINGLHNARQFTDILPDKQVDAQLGYEFETGALKGLGLLLQVNNLTNSPYATRQGNGFGDVIAPQEYNTYGRQYLFGVNYKL
jgi:iron complex outermembrane receptor protein